MMADGGLSEKPEKNHFQHVLFFSVQQMTTQIQIPFVYSYYIKS